MIQARQQAQSLRCGIWDFGFWIRLGSVLCLVAPNGIDRLWISDVAILFKYKKTLSITHSTPNRLGVPPSYFHNASIVYNMAFHCLICPLPLPRTTVCIWFVPSLPSPKLTYPLKIDPWKRRFLLQTIIDRGYVSFKLLCSLGLR